MNAWPRRVFDLARFLYVQRVSGFDAPTEPELDAATRDRFVEYLANAPFYLEFGSGGSTLEAARLAVPTVSVESDRFYAATVRAALPPGSDVAILDARIGLTVEWGRPFLAKPTAARSARWMTYVRLPLDAARARNVMPTLILVDGRFRRACALGAAQLADEMAHPTTIVIDDYVGRDQYRDLEDHLGSPTIVGRSAWFEAAGRGHATITDGLIKEAICDVR